MGHAWVTGDAGHGSADWWVTWVTGYKMWPIVSSAIDGNIPKRYYQITNRKYNSNTWNNRCFFETRSSNISATDWAISLKFGQQNGFRPFQISDVTKSGAGPGSRFETPGGPSSKVDVTLFYVPEWTVVVVAAYRRGLQKRCSLGGHRILQHLQVSVYVVILPDLLDPSAARPAKSTSPVSSMGSRQKARWTWHRCILCAWHLFLQFATWSKLAVRQRQICSKLTEDRWMLAISLFRTNWCHLA